MRRTLQFAARDAAGPRRLNVMTGNPLRDAIQLSETVAVQVGVKAKGRESCCSIHQTSPSRPSL